MGFGEGLSRGLDRAQFNQKLKLERQKAVFEQQQTLKQEMDMRVKETAENLAKFAGEWAKTYYSASPEKKQAEIERYRQAAGHIIGSGLQVIKTGMQSGLANQADYDRAKQIFAMAAQPPDIKANEKVVAGEVGAKAMAEVPAQEQVINAQSQASMKQQANASYLARQVPNVINFQNPDNLDDVVGVDINAPDARKKVDELIKAGYIRATTGGSGSSQILPIPENAQQDFTNSFAALKLLDVMEGKISTSGRFEGPFQEALAFFGINPNAVEFNVARNQFKLMAQSLIKGTPSNFDVNTVIATLPALMSPETTNQSRINLARDLFTQLIKDKIGFYKGTNRTIPNEIIDQAKEYGIDVAGVTPTDGNTFDRGGAMRILLNKSSDADLITMLNSEDVSSSAKEQIASEMERRISSGR